VKRLHLIDGTFELYRAHYSQRPGHKTPEGTEAKATVGLLASLLALLHDPDEAVTHVAIAFDNPIRSFRNDLFSGYKGDEGVPPELRAQFDLAEEAARALGVVVWPMNEWEADDALATAAARWQGDVDEVRLLSPDKDLGQCLRGKRVVQVDRIRRKLIDEEGLQMLRGVRPESVPDLLALTGDTADGIPGLPGIGDKTAAALLGKYVHLEDIPADPRAWSVKVRGAERIAQTLTERREDVQLYRRLATLVTDVPLEEGLDDLAFQGVPRRVFTAFCERLGANTLKDRPKRWDNTR